MTMNQPQAVRSAPPTGVSVQAEARSWLHLAAMPAFAAMAAATGLLGEGGDMLCSGMHAASPLTGMAPMYLLMSAFHAGPWLKLLQGRVRGGPVSADG